MQKIGFCDKYLLTQAVLNGKNTMTRRVCKDYATGNIIYGDLVVSWRYYPYKGSAVSMMADGSIMVAKAPYRVGEVVAVAQSYYDVYGERQVNGSFYKWCVLHNLDHKKEIHDMEELQKKKGWTNKMFVKPSLMPHQIQITGVRIERLQEISEEDCLKEGIEYSKYERNWFYTNDKNTEFHAPSPRKAFAALINRPGVGRKALWESNPFVVGYEFKLVK